MVFLATEVRDFYRHKSTKGTKLTQNSFSGISCFFFSHRSTKGTKLTQNNFSGISCFFL